MLAGDDRGKTGRVLKVDAAKQRAIVEGVNVVTKATKPSAKHPQGVLPKAKVGVAHGADEPLGQILLPAKGVDDPAVLGQRHGVDGEIPPGQIMLQGVPKDHRVGVAAVGIAHVGAEGGHLQTCAVQQDGDRAVGEAGRDGFFKQGHHLLRAGGGGDVPVAGSAAQQEVADTAAHGMGGKSAAPQGGKALCDGGGQRKHRQRLLTLWRG